MSDEAPKPVKLSTPASTPMCDIARAIEYIRPRLAHYRTCSDPRCAARKAGYLRVIELIKSGK